jgi:hypothetical protein
MAFRTGEVASLASDLSVGLVPGSNFGGGRDR